MVVLTLFLLIMTALATNVILHQRRAMAAFKCDDKSVNWPWVSRLKHALKMTAAKDSPTAVGALHAVSVLLAAAPCQVFSSPMSMHFRIPLEDKTILIICAPWFPVRCGAQCSGVPAVRI